MNENHKQTTTALFDPEEWRTQAADISEMLRESGFTPEITQGALGGMGLLADQQKPSPVVKQLGYLAMVRAYLEFVERLKYDDVHRIAGAAESMLLYRLQCPDEGTGSSAWNTLVTNMVTSFNGDPGWNVEEPLLELGKEAQKAGDAEVELILETVGTTIQGYICGW
jgi:hypothetical protein